LAYELCLGRKNEGGNGRPFIVNDQQVGDRKLIQMFRECGLANHEFVQNQSK
jgi:hypothetical protein